MDDTWQLCHDLFALVSLAQYSESVRRKIGLMVIAALLLGACSSSNSGANESVSSDAPISESSPESSVAATNSDDSYDISATQINGASFSLREALTSSPVVLWFWAPG